MKRILAVTSTRADYGILRRLLLKLDATPDIDLRIVATGTHLQPEYGMTVAEIEQDGFHIDKVIPMGLSDTAPGTIVNAMARLSGAMGDYLQDNSFDLMILLGDRSEMLSVAGAAVVMQVPICHLHGGELSLGSYDEFIRHAITKMSHLHLTSTEEYLHRVLQLGESEENVINVGSLGVESVVASMENMDRRDLASLSVGDVFGVVLFHPETLGDTGLAARQTDVLLGALRAAAMQFVFVGANSDAGAEDIMTRVRTYVEQDDMRSFVIPSASTKVFHTLVHFSQFLIGNSSSGLIEVPSLGVPTINLGDRQKGRVRGGSVIDVPVTEGAIRSAIMKAQSDDFRQQARLCENPYYQPDSLEKAYGFITSRVRAGIPLVKNFVDRNFK